MPLTVALSGPERTRAAAEVALEDARIPIYPADHHAPMDWESKLTPLPSGKKSKAAHGFLTVRCEDADELNRAVALVEKAGWVLRVHYDEPEAPKPSAEQVLTATIADMQAEIAALKAKVG